MRAFDHAATGSRVGGDNSAECEFARGKQALQRVNRLGGSSPKTMHIDLLASTQLLAKPEAVLASLALYRISRRISLGSDILAKSKDQDWFCCSGTRLHNVVLLVVGCRGCGFGYGCGHLYIYIYI